MLTSREIDEVEEVRSREGEGNDLSVIFSRRLRRTYTWLTRDEFLKVFLTSSLDKLSVVKSLGHSLGLLLSVAGGFEAPKISAIPFMLLLSKFYFCEGMIDENNTQDTTKCICDIQ